MKKLVNWESITKTGNDVATEFIELADLDSIDSCIIEDRMNRIPQFVTAMKIEKSVEFITKRIKNYLIPTYIECQKQFPDILPEIGKGIKYEYKNIECVVSIIDNDVVYTVQICGMDFRTFADIRLYVIDQINEKYGINLTDLKEYKAIVTGNYCRVF